MASVGFVLAHYNDAFVIQTLRKLEQIAPSFPPSQMVFVANHEDAHRRLSASLAHRFDGASELLMHDNSGMEFGAYQAGVDRLTGRMDADWIVIGNDTFAAHGNFSGVYRQRMAQELHQLRDFPTIVGRTHALSRSYQIQGFRTHRWVQTSLFAINRAALHALGGRVYRHELESLVTESSDMSKFFSDTMDPVLRRHLEVWLFRTEPGPHWYASEPLQPHNVAKMARKARSIMQEKFLAAALEGSGAEFVNLNDLSVAKKMLRKIDDKVFEFTRSGSRAR